LEERAVAEGYGETWLETGIAQPDAISLYVAAGYEARAPYGEFKDDPRNRSFFRLLTG
jgi:putative acetyltransferase